MNYYFLSLGTNINPEENVWNMLDKLNEHFGELNISKIEQTSAVGFDSDKLFLNLCVRLKSELPKDELKKILIQIEEELGRDRSHPECKTSDRPADIDILFSIKDNTYFISDHDIPKEKYVLPTFIELARFLEYDFTAQATGIPQKKTLERDELIIGDSVKTIFNNSSDL